MKSLILAATIVALPAFAEVKVAVGDINDKRTTGKFFSGLEVQLNLSGPELSAAKGIRTTVKAATDDTGAALPKAENRFLADGFEPLEKAFGFSSGDGKKAEEFQVKLEFGNPPRSAKAIQSIAGTIELLMPAKDPAAVITASVSKDAGKPLENPALKAAGVQFSLRKPGKEEKKEAGAFGFGGGLGENDLGYQITDPNKKVASVEFFDAAGKKLESSGRMSSGFGGAQTVTITFREKPPGDAIAKIYVVTDKSVVTVPLALKNVVLP